MHIGQDVRTRALTIRFRWSTLHQVPIIQLAIINRRRSYQLALAVFSPEQHMILQIEGNTYPYERRALIMVRIADVAGNNESSAYA